MTRVLLVEDDLDLGELLAEVLAGEGYAVRTADSLRRALEVARAEAPFDVLLTDLHLPDADGETVARALRVPLSLALTGTNAPGQTPRLLEAGFAAVLLKPLTRRQLLDAVGLALATRAAEAHP